MNCVKCQSFVQSVRLSCFLVVYFRDGYGYPLSLNPQQIILVLVNLFLNWWNAVENKCLVFWSQRQNKYSTTFLHCHSTKIFDDRNSSCLFFGGCIPHLWLCSKWNVCGNGLVIFFFYLWESWMAAGHTGNWQVYSHTISIGVGLIR